MNLIKERRKSAGLTQEEFSKFFEIPLDTVKNWDSGRRKPPGWAEKLIIEKLEIMTEREEMSREKVFKKVTK